MNCNDNNTNSSCIGNILNVINILQENAQCGDQGLNSCDSFTFGCVSVLFNTRPVSLITCCNNGNEPLVMPTTRTVVDDTTVFSSVFRVEKVDNNCATFRVLIPTTVDGTTTFTATDSFFTIDLSCVCAIRCFGDTYVSGV